MDSTRPTGRPLLRAALGVLVGVGAGAGGVWLALRPEAPAPAPVASAAVAELYQCPMHPSVTSPHAGTCPICGMNLVRVAAPAPGERKVAFYRSPMNPKQTSPTPAKDEMGMDYVAVYEDEVGASETAVKGLAAVTIDPQRQQLIGLRTDAVKRGDVGGSWRTVGRIEVDQTRVRSINVKVDGFVERLYVDFIGRPVRKGEPLFSIYSPSLLSAQNEYLLALDTQARLAQAGALPSGGDTLVASARRKLELWDVPAAEIARLEQTRQPSKTLTLVSPIAGVVTAKTVVQGARLTAGDAPFEITDLGVVWAMADAYENDLSKLRVGMRASLKVQAWPNRPFEGRVEFIEPLLDPKSRTVKVHIHVPNPTGELKPEMYGEVEFKGSAHEGLLIPLDAVVHSGSRDVVFLALGAGKFLPRQVKLGAQTGSQVEVIEGLEEGQDVVTRANFLVDSESQLRASLSSLAGPAP